LIPALPRGLSIFEKLGLKPGFFRVSPGAIAIVGPAVRAISRRPGKAANSQTKRAAGIDLLAESQP